MFSFNESDKYSCILIVLVFVYFFLIDAASEEEQKDGKKKEEMGLFARIITFGKVSSKTRDNILRALVHP